jgi:choline dehydrogenase-like flavoprotein
MAELKSRYDVVVIGTGFGGSMTALSLACAFQKRDKGEQVLMLERGTWWTTPVGTVQDKEVQTYDFLKEKGEPVQYWSSVDHFKGFIDIFFRCFRRRKNEDGLYELTYFGERGLLGIFKKSDGVSVLRASGVGGGSLVYSNVTIRPPEVVFEDPRWPAWDKADRDAYFGVARDAIGYGVIYAQDQRGGAGKEDDQINSGLSHIVTRSARLNPHWYEKPNPVEPGLKIRQIWIKEKDKPSDPPGRPDEDPGNRLWIDRARVFQTAMRKLTRDYGTVQSSINDIEPEPSPFHPVGPKNYCERQGRCNVGCLPGARHTLNKQLMRAIHGTRTHKPDFPENLSLQALAEVDVIEALPQGGYRVHYLQRDAARPWRTTKKTVDASRVIVAAGCVGTNEIILRSKERGTLPNLSEKVGLGFSTNGDYLAFLEDTKERVSLTRGPVTTSFGHFNLEEARLPDGPAAQPDLFHTVEDNGIAPAFSSVVGYGITLLRSMSKGRDPRLFTLWALLLWGVKQVRRYVGAFFTNHLERHEVFQSEAERVAKMMCVAAMGREASVGQFRLGRGRDTPLRVRRTDGKEFHEDPIYDEIRATLDRFAGELTDNSGRSFINPFLTGTADSLGAKTVALSHPLGGCRMAKDATEGVVDEFGRVFDASRVGMDHPFHEGLYITDASIIPTALGVNPSLTIAALALRCADKIIEELPPLPVAEGGGCIPVPKIVAPTATV